MSNIIPATARTALKRSLLRSSVAPARFSSTMHDNDPEVLEAEKLRNLSRQQHKTSTPIPEAPGWNESLASASEAAIKVREAIRRSIPTGLILRARVSTSRMHNDDEGSPEARYARDEVDGPLKQARGDTVVETIQHKEDVITRKTVV
ncbi:uncharacterized protein BXZ73DRAFT_86581 [Epithele typhae]|uniref:uncharacterized protein n=1 Tax=Epithele typhae TaxID=378194 RepID=UPI00200745AB|nr:uncharacterized protein BXZ73DRAFT_86581 [Epithele typhae]KAH9944990.1 hypothetical protein BXZ73DRAFT_86581 [Epithele typhae]